MYIHCVLSRHWPSPLKRQNADHSMLVAEKLANGEEPKESRLPAPHNRFSTVSRWRTPAWHLLEGFRGGAFGGVRSRPAGPLHLCNRCASSGDLGERDRAHSTIVVGGPAACGSDSPRRHSWNCRGMHSCLVTSLSFVSMCDSMTSTTTTQCALPQRRMLCNAMDWVQFMAIIVVE